MRRRVTQRLLRIQAVCIWHCICVWRPKGKKSTDYLTTSATISFSSVRLVEGCCQTGEISLRLSFSASWSNLSATGAYMSYNDWSLLVPEAHAAWNWWKCMLTLLRQINCCLLNFSSASIFKVLQCRSNLVKMLFQCPTAWFRMRWDAE